MDSERCSHWKKKKNNPTSSGSSKSLKRTEIYIQLMLRVQVSFEKHSRTGNWPTPSCLSQGRCATWHCQSLKQRAGELGGYQGNRLGWAEHCPSKNHHTFSIFHSHNNFHLWLSFEQDLVYHTLIWPNDLVENLLKLVLLHLVGRRAKWMLECSRLYPNMRGREVGERDGPPAGEARWTHRQL